MRNASWIVLLSLASPPVFAQEQTIEAGLYELVTKSAEDPVDTARICLDAKDIVKSLRPDLAEDCKQARTVIADG